MTGRSLHLNITWTFSTYRAVNTVRTEYLKENSLIFNFERLKVIIRPCEGSGGQSPACYRGSQSSIPSSGNVRFVVDKVTLWQVSLSALRFPLSVSYHQCSIHIICILTLLLSWENQNAMRCRISESTGQNVRHTAGQGLIMLFNFRLLLICTQPP